MPGWITHSNFMFSNFISCCLKKMFSTQIPCCIISLPLFCACQHSFPLSKCNCLIFHTGERNRIPSRFHQTQRDNDSPRNVIVEFSVHSTASPSLISPSQHQPASDLWASPVRRVEIHADRPAVRSLSWLALSCHAALHSSPPACATPSTLVSVSPEQLSALTDFSRVELYILMSIAQYDRQDS